jgi:hypothetical protein
VETGHFAISMCHSFRHGQFIFSCLAQCVVSFSLPALLGIHNFID